MDAKELFQKEVLEDIKAIARELSQVQSFSGLLAQQQKIQGLYEKYIFLKQLNTSKYQQLLDTPVLVKEKVETNTQEVEKRDFYETQVQEEVTVVEESNEEPKEEVVSEIEIIEEAVQEVQNVEEKTEERTGGLKPIGIEIAEIKVKPVETGKKYDPIKLDFNDSIAFISQLFKGSKADMDAEFKILNETNNLQEAKKWMEEMFHKYNWENKEEFVERLSGLIVHRFES